MDNRRMCPHCRAFITNSDRTCPYCGHEVGRRAIERRDSGGLIAGLIPSAHFTTTLILLINIVMFAASALQSNAIMDMDGQVLWSLGAKFGPSIWLNHEYWRLVTAGFLHGGVYSDFDVAPLPVTVTAGRNLAAKSVYRSESGGAARVGKGGPALHFEGFNGSIRLHTK